MERDFGYVTFLPGENRGKYPNCHSLFLKEAGVLIDPAAERRRLEELRDEHKVKTIWLSHWHEDHFLNLDLFADLPIWISRPDAPALCSLDTFLDYYGVDEEERGYWEPLMTDFFRYKPREIAGYLSNGDCIDLGGETAEIIAAPGHTPGHLAIHFHESRVLFLADYDLTPFGPWYGDASSSIEQTIESLRRLKKIEADVWMTCHEKGIFEENPGLAWDNYENVIYRREEKLLDFLTEPRSMEDIINAWIVYGKPREPLMFYRFGERRQMLKHLERLMNQGIVGQEDDLFFKTA